MTKHFSDVKQGRKYKLHNSIRKYGKENFTYEQIDEAKSAEELRQKEIKMIAELKPELNISPGGSMSFHGHAHTEEHKQYMSKLLSGKNNPAYGKPGYWADKEIPQWVREKMKIGNKNKQKKNCVYCNKDFDPVNYKRWHDQNCKSKGGY